MGQPLNVRIQREDGSEEPCVLMHVGDEDGDGTDVWEIMGPTFVLGRDKILADEIPGHTALRFTQEEEL